jgi:hypothetical protein
MADLGFHFTRRRALTSLLFVLLLAPIPLIQISARLADPQKHGRASNDVAFWFIVAVVLMGSAVRGNRSALGLWAVVSGVVGSVTIAWSLFVEPGPVRILGGMIAIAASITFFLLRDELRETPESDDVLGRSREDAHAA